MIPLVRMQAVKNINTFLNKHGHREVYIRSHQWGAYWRPNRQGYTYEKVSAGVYTLSEAFDATSHCGSEKEIFYQFVKKINNVNSNGNNSQS